jgi:hypothetical protein
LSRRPKQRIHRHGCYLRFENCEDQQRLRIERFVSPRCGRTLSLCPKAGSLRCLEHRDGGIGVRCPGLGHRFTSHERGCLWRAFERFAARVTSLCALLGQMMDPSNQVSASAVVSYGNWTTSKGFSFAWAQSSTLHFWPIPVDCSPDSERKGSKLRLDVRAEG